MHLVKGKWRLLFLHIAIGRKLQMNDATFQIELKDVILQPENCTENSWLVSFLFYSSNQMNLPVHGICYEIIGTIRNIYVE